MSDVVAFLRARLDEDEAIAHNALGLLGMEAPWHDIETLRQRGLTRADARHVARHSSRRVLCEVEAKRRILEQHDAWPVLVEGPPEFEQHADPSDLQGITFRMSQQMAWLTTREYVARFGVEAPTTPILRALASIYADHPDYDPTWEQPGGVA